MEIKRLLRPSALVIELTGKLEIGQAQNFETSFAEMAKGHPGIVALDLSKVEYIDSSGIGSLVKSLTVTRNLGGDLVLFGLNATIQQVFTLAKLNTFFRILTREEFNFKYPDH